MKKDYIVFGLLFLFLSAVVYVTATLSTGRTTFFGRAANTGEVSLEGSKVFASPVIAKSGGQERIGITVFVLNTNGLGVPRQNVSLVCRDQKLCTDAGAVIFPTQPNTGEKGEAMFDISSPVPATIELQAAVAGRSIPQTVTVVFQ